MKNRTKIALIVSLILNVAFISGFATKKFLSAHRDHGAHDSQIHKETAAAHDRHTADVTQVMQQLPCENDPQKIGYRHLCTKHPKFKEIFHGHRDHYQSALNDLIKLKTAFLNELKKEKVDRAAAEKLLKEVNRLGTELNENNYRHLLSVKELLAPEDFANLLDCMTRTLCTHKEKGMPQDMGNIPCKENKN